MVSIRYTVPDALWHIFCKNDSYSKESFNGVVKEKYIDYDDHTSRKFKDVHNNIYYLPVAQRSILFDSIMIGDSIVKRKGEVTGYVYRNDSLVLEIDYSTSIQK